MDAEVTGNGGEGGGKKRRAGSPIPRISKKKILKYLKESL